VILRANSTAAKLLGMTKEDLFMRPLSCFIRSEGADQQDLPQEGWFASVGSGDRELRMMRGDGEWFWADLKSIAFRAGDDDLVHVIFSDITTRKNTDEALRDSEDVFRQIVHSAEEGIWKINAASLTDYVNPKMAQMMGYAPEEMLGRPIDDFLDDEGRAQLAGLIARRKGGIAEQFEFKYLRKDGSTLWAFVSTNPIINANGQYVGAVALLTDIRSRREAEKTLRETEERYKLLADHTDDIVGLNDTKGNTLYISPSYFRKTGWTREELDDRNWHFPVHPDDAELVGRARADNLAGKATRIEHRIRCKDGSWLWCDTSCKPLPGPDGKVWRLLVWTHDITARKAVEAELRESNEKLERRVAARTEKLRALTTELTQVEERERLRIADTLHEGLLQLLAVASLQIGKLKGELANETSLGVVQDLQHCIDEAVRVGRTLTHELYPPPLQSLGLGAALTWLGRWHEDKYGLRVEVDAHPGINVEEMELRTTFFRAANELLTNVRKHAQTGRARLNLRHAEVGSVSMEVSDSGVGFDFAAVREREGSIGGLGLFSLRERVEALGGRFDVCSAPGRGSSITVTLPTAEPRIPDSSASDKTSSTPRE
jgi:PAS domain S-box-containing protein